MKQRSDEWYAWRRQGLGASDAAPILGISPFRTLHDVYRDKTDPDYRDPITPPMAHGILLEDEARRMYTLETGIEVMPMQRTYEAWPVMRASLDGVSFERDLVIELKAPYGQRSHDEAKAGTVPTHYLAQMQHQLAVCDIRHTHFFSYRPADTACPSVLLEVERDDAYIATLIAAEQAFWTAHVVPRIPPCDSKPTLERTDRAWREAAADYVAAKARMEQAKASLIDMAAGHARVTGGGVRVRLQERKGSVDYAAVPGVQDVDLEAYRKPATVSTVVEVVKPRKGNAA